MTRLAEIERTVATADAEALRAMAVELRAISANLRRETAGAEAVIAHAPAEIEMLLRIMRRVDARTAALRRQAGGVGSDGRPREAVSVDESGRPAKGDDVWGDALRYLDECELDRLRNRGAIDDRQHHAGMRFRARWLAAHPQSGYSGRYAERVAACGAWTPHIGRLDAEEAVRRLLEGLGQPAALAVQAVAGEDQATLGRLPALREGLAALAAELGVPSDFRPLR